MTVLVLFHGIVEFLKHHAPARAESPKSFLLPRKLNFDISHSIH